MSTKLVVVLAALLCVGGILTVKGQGEQCFYLLTIAVIKIMDIAIKPGTHLLHPQSGWVSVECRRILVDCNRT